MPTTRVRSIWQSGDLMFCAKEFNIASDTPLFRIGKTGYAMQLKVHNRPAVTGSSVEVRARPNSATPIHEAINAITEMRPGYPDATSDLTSGTCHGINGTIWLASGYTITATTASYFSGVHGYVVNQGTLNGDILLSCFYGLIADGGTWTAVNHLAGLWLDTHLDTAVSAGTYSWIYLTKNGTTAIDNVMYVSGTGQITNLFNFPNSGGMTGSNTVADATFANWKPIKMSIGGTTHYLIAAQTIS
jgi:hypothetical protein